MDNVSETVPVVLLTDKSDISGHPLDICIADISWGDELEYPWKNS